MALRPSQTFPVRGIPNDIAGGGGRHHCGPSLGGHRGGWGARNTSTPVYQPGSIPPRTWAADVTRSILSVFFLVEIYCVITTAVTTALCSHDGLADTLLQANWRIANLP